MSEIKTQEFNFDGLVGLSHNYAGLSYGNVASMQNANARSAPRKAALQGLAKMQQLADMGLAQAVLPPQERPAVDALRNLGFTGSDVQVIQKAARTAPEIFHACCSASSMWTANAATVSPSPDCQDGKLHFTAANLSSKFHRAIEAQTTSRVLQSIFKDDKHFKHHPALIPGEHFADEGAANHTRFCSDYDAPGLELFVHGRVAFNDLAPKPKKFPARQSKEACVAIERLHQLDPDKTVHAQQNPDVIDQGVFHNDVIAVGNRDLMFYHEQAFLNTDTLITELKQKSASEFNFVEVKTSEVSVEDAVASYMFNSQLVSLPNQQMALIAPRECFENQNIADYLNNLTVDKFNPITYVHYMDVRESMRNGGGPACLRLRVVLTPAEQKAINANVFINDQLFADLTTWVKKHYREELLPKDLVDPELLKEGRTALDELTQLLRIGSVYPFQLS